MLRENVKRILALKGKSPDTYMIDTWCEVLRQFPEKEVIKALGACMGETGFFEIGNVLQKLQPQNSDLAIDEWDKCMQVAKDGEAGYNQLSDATKRALRAAGGIKQLRFTESEFTKNKMRENFMEIFDATKTQIGFDNKQAVSFLEELNKRRGAIE